LEEVAVHGFDVWVVFSSAKNIQAAVAAGSPKYGGRWINAASLWAACHPIYTFNYHFASHWKFFCGPIRRLLLYRCLYSMCILQIRHSKGKRICSRR
jgi:hypothetical protein